MAKQLNKTRVDTLLLLPGFKYKQRKQVHVYFQVL